jgi:hypothetical protein
MVWVVRRPSASIRSLRIGTVVIPTIVLLIIRIISAVLIAAAATDLNSVEVQGYSPLKTEVYLTGCEVAVVAFPDIFKKVSELGGGIYVGILEIFGLRM